MSNTVCYFCRRKFTKKHLCGEYVAYDILRPLYLQVLLDTQPGNCGQLHVQVMKVITEENLFQESRDVERTVAHYLNYFVEEYDIT